MLSCIVVQPNFSIFEIVVLRLLPQWCRINLRPYTTHRVKQWSSILPVLINSFRLTVFSYFSNVSPYRQHLMSTQVVSSIYFVSLISPIFIFISVQLLTDMIIWLVTTSSFSLNSTFVIKMFVYMFGIDFKWLFELTATIDFTDILQK